MTLLDFVSIITAVACVYAIINWWRFMRSWPLFIGVMIAILSNLSFLFVRFFIDIAPSDLNLFSAVRVFITVIVLAVIPSSLRRFDL